MRLKYTRGVIRFSNCAGLSRLENTFKVLSRSVVETVQTQTSKYDYILLEHIH